MELVDLMPLHPVLTHPHTGESLRAIFQMDDGEYVWPLLGADGEDDGKGGEENADDDEGTDEEDSEDGDEESSETGKSGKSKSGKEETVSKEEFERLKARMKAADKSKSKAEQERDELKRKDQTDLENAKADLDKATKERDKLQGSFTKLARTNAFLIASQQASIAWHNPKVALKAADLDDLEIDEDGNVDGIDAVVKKLAKDQPYLVNKGKDADDEEDADGKPPARRGTSGSGVGSTKTPKGKKNNGVLSDDELRKRFSIR
jgi:hypothetical protein